MRLEVLRIFADWLSDETTGVNAELPTVERDAGDPLPPLLAGIYDATRHEFVVTRKEPPALPCLLVMSEGDVAIDGHAMTNTYRDTVEPFAVVIRYLTMGGTDAAAAVAAGEYTLRAAVRSINTLMLNANAATRTRNNVCLYDLVRIAYVPVRETVGDVAVAGALILDCELRDAAPLG